MSNKKRREKFYNGARQSMNEPNVSIGSFNARLNNRNGSPRSRKSKKKEKASPRFRRRLSAINLVVRDDSYLPETFNYREVSIRDNGS